MATDLSKFQEVLEAIEKARAKAFSAVSDDDVTIATDDQDAYPRGIALAIDRKDPRWFALRFLSKHLNWVSLVTRTKHLHITPPCPLRFHSTEIGYLEVLSSSLNESGIKCSADVYYR